MKADLFMFDDELAFSFRQSDIKTTEDKQVICRMIEHLYHMMCVDYSMDEEELDDVLDNSEGEENVGFTVIEHEGRARLLMLFPDQLK